VIGIGILSGNFIYKRRVPVRGVNFIKLERRIGRGERILDSKNLLFYFSIDEVC
jgi:hypothetical protein